MNTKLKKHVVLTSLLRLPLAAGLAMSWWQLFTNVREKAEGNYKYFPPVPTDTLTVLVPALAVLLALALYYRHGGSVVNKLDRYTWGATAIALIPVPFLLFTAAILAFMNGGIALLLAICAVIPVAGLIWHAHE